MDWKSKRSWKIGYYIVVALLILYGFGLALFKRGVGGVRFFVANSGSMQPTIQPGSLLVTKQEHFYQTADIITFLNNPVDSTNVASLKSSTHRLLRFELSESGDLVMVTKGDANAVADRQTVARDQILGRVVVNIPVVGSLLQTAVTPLWILAYQLVIGVVCLVELLKMQFFKNLRLGFRMKVT